MSDLNTHVADYLRLRRGLGFKLVFPGRVLPQLVAFIHDAGGAALTIDLAIAWAGLPTHVQPISRAHRLGAARGFARYLQTIDPATEIPPCGIWPSVAARPVPVGAEYCVVPGQAAFRYSLMRPSQWVDFTTRR